MAMRKSVLGAEHVARAEANKTDFDADFQRIITEGAWGSIWTRAGIDKKTRHMVTLAIIAALGKNDELAMHIRATRNTGVTLERSEEHTSELQSLRHLVCRLLLALTLYPPLSPLFPYTTLSDLRFRCRFPAYYNGGRMGVHLDTGWDR